jgi:hypothetical protein
MDNFPHLPFEPVKIGRSNVPYGGGHESPETKKNKADRPSHKQNLENAIEGVRKQYEAEQERRVKLGLPELPAGMPMLLKVDEGFDIEDFKGRAWGFEVVCETDEGYVIVVAPDVDLNTFQEKLKKFIEKQPGGLSIASIHEIIVEDDHRSRLERILHPRLLEEWDEIVKLPRITVEISIECLGTKRLPTRRERLDFATDERFKAATIRYVQELTAYYEEYDQLREDREKQFFSFLREGSQKDALITEANLLDGVAFADSFTVMVSVSGAELLDIAINYPYVFDIDSKDLEIFEDSGAVPLTEEKLLEIYAPNLGAPFLVIIDSGIQEGHPYLASAIATELSRNFLAPVESAHDDTTDYGGHGTRVAGAALFPDGVPEGKYQLPFFIVNAKILDKDAKIPENVSPARLLEIIVEHYQGIDSSFKIFNHSIASSNAARRRYMSSWAAKMDDLSYSYDVLFVQAAGNVRPRNQHFGSLGIEQHLTAGREYPEYLLEASCKIANPAQSLNALTVGSISGKVLAVPDYRSIGDLEGPSPFSRSGPTIWNVIKPDVVAVGGNLVRTTDDVHLRVKEHPETCLELPRKSDGGKQKDSSVVGTSFSAPMVAHYVTKLQDAFPEESTLLYRGLIAQSARWPNWESVHSSLATNFSHFGFGLPSFDRASSNSENRITFYSRGRKEISAKTIHFYEIPIPEVIRRPGLEHDVLMEVTLSYVAKPRRTRKNPRKYLSTWVDWTSSNLREPVDQFMDRSVKSGRAYLSTSFPEISWVLGETKNEGQVEELKRNVGTLQKDWAVIKSYNLEESFSVAVRGHEGWDTSDEYPAFYSLIVSLEVINADIQLYEEIRNEVDFRSQIEIQL